MDIEVQDSGLNIMSTLVMTFRHIIVLIFTKFCSGYLDVVELREMNKLISCQPPTQKKTATLNYQCSLNTTLMNT